MVDHETIPVYNVTLTADDGVNAVSCDVIIYIDDVPEPLHITYVNVTLDVWEHETAARELIHMDYINGDKFDKVQFFMGVYPTNQKSFAIDTNRTYKVSSDLMH